MGLQSAGSLPWMLTQAYVAHINSDGSLEESFDPVLDVSMLAPNGDDSIPYALGAFVSSAIGSTTCNYVAAFSTTSVCQTKTLRGRIRNDCLPKPLLPNNYNTTHQNYKGKIRKQQDSPQPGRGGEWYHGFMVEDLNSEFLVLVV